MQEVRVAQERGLERLREQAHLGWQVAAIFGGDKAPEFDKWLSQLGLRPKRAPSAGRLEDDKRRAETNARNVRAAFAKGGAVRKGGGPPT